MKNQFINLSIVIFITLGLTTPLFSAHSSGIMVVGVTNGSIYTDYVKPRWYGKNISATLKKDKRRPKPFKNGSKIKKNGSYELIVMGAEDRKKISFSIDSRRAHAVIATNADLKGAKLKIKFNGGMYYAGGKIPGTPVIAIWAENLSGNYLHNFYVSALPATNIMRYTDDWRARPQALPNWMHKSGAKRRIKEDWVFLADPKTGIPADIDAVSGATQKRGFVINTRTPDQPAYPDKIRVCFEINQSFDSGWYFFGDNDQHEEDGFGTFNRDAFFRGTGVGEPAIVYAVEIDLRSNGAYHFGGHDGQRAIGPVGYSHYAGRNGKLYNDFFAKDGKTERYKFDHAPRMVEALTIEVLPIR